MATIRVNEDAPQEAVHFTLPTVEFDLSPGDTYETDDFRVIDEAVTHPWLAVEAPVEASYAHYRDNAPDPEHDPLSADNPVNQAAMTPEAAVAFEAERDAEEDAIFNPQPVDQPEFADEHVQDPADVEAEMLGNDMADVPVEESVVDVPAEEAPVDVPDTTTEDPNF